jgi:hypothetical protein
MSTLNPRGNLPGGIEAAESETVRLVARARVMMLISALTTLLAVAAVVAVIGYRVYAGGGAGPPSEDIVTCRRADAWSRWRPPPGGLR